MTLSPLVEFHHELTGPTAKMEMLGYLLRAGTDVRVQLNPHTSLVVQAQLAAGTLWNQGQTVSMLGPRVGTLIEWSR